MNKCVVKNILLTGATGKLGTQIVQFGLIKNLLTPSRKELDIRQKGSVKKYFRRNKIHGVIHCAAIARMIECEKKPIQALETNIVGTCNLVEEVLDIPGDKRIRFIHVSTDGVYPCTKGHYSEHDPAIPYNRYGWTKLGAECAVNLLPDFCIIRTRFFDPGDIPFNTYALDSYTSSVPITDLVQAIEFLLHSDFIGTVNIGAERKSDYMRYKQFKPSIKKCRLDDISRKIDFEVSRDASLNSRLWKTIEKHR